MRRFGPKLFGHRSRRGGFGAIAAILVALVLYTHSGPGRGTDIFSEHYTGKIVRFENVTVPEVVDGDTAHMMVNGHNTKVRLEGVDTPETRHPEKPVEFYGPEASEYTKKRLLNQTVTLEVQVNREGALNKDKYGRLLAVIWLGEENFNLTLIKEGYARATHFKPFEYYDLYHQWETRAKEEHRGLWRGEGTLQKSSSAAP